MTSSLLDLEARTRETLGAPTAMLGDEAAFLRRLVERLEGGLLVPLRVAREADGPGHLVLAIGLRTTGVFERRRELQLYDPWAGNMIWVKEEDIRNRGFRMGEDRLITHAWLSP